MRSDLDTGAPPGESDTDESAAPVVEVPLGRRVEIVGDLLLPAEPTDCSRASVRDVARRLEDWQGPGVVVFCGRLVAPACPGAHLAQALERHAELTDALQAFAQRPDSHVIVLMTEADRDPDIERTPPARVRCRDRGRPRS